MTPPVHLTRDLLDAGWCRSDLHRTARAGGLRVVRRGAWTDPVEDADPERSAAERRRLDHRDLIEATQRLVHPGSVLSHDSAALLHALPDRGARWSMVHLTRPRGRGGRIAGPVHLWTGSLPAGHVTELDRYRLTSATRTVIDLARSTPLLRAVTVGDAALHQRLTTPDALTRVLDDCSRWPGVGGARRAVRLMDGRSERVGESFSRVTFATAGIPAPVPQHVIVDGRGRFVARVDFCWPELGIVGEFDGRIKYAELVPVGRSVTDVVLEEKAREDAVRERGWLVVRWTWSDLFPPHRLVQRWHDARRRQAARR